MPVRGTAGVVHTVATAGAPATSRLDADVASLDAEVASLDAPNRADHDGWATRTPLDPVQAECFQGFDVLERAS